MAVKQAKNTPTRRRTRTHKSGPAKELPLSGHIQELRRRLILMIATVGVCSVLAFTIQKTLTEFLLAPAHGQQFVFTTPGGGFDFQLKLCFYSGLLASIPVILYQVFLYIQPLLRHESKHFLRSVTLFSTLLAGAGVAFGYFIGLPAAMQFLLNSFSSEQIRALITIQSYMNFVLVYLLGAALLFQVPLVLLLINRIKPLSPDTLFRQQKWVILGAFLAGAIISPTPDIQNQLLLTGPIILLYETTVAFIWLRALARKRPKKIQTLLEKDESLQLERQIKFQKARMLHQAMMATTQTKLFVTQSATLERPAVAPTKFPLSPLFTEKSSLQQITTTAATKTPPTPSAAANPPTIARQRRYINDFRRPSYNQLRRPTEAKPDVDPRISLGYAQS